MEDRILRALAKELETPAYVFDRDAFLRRALAVKSEFGAKTGICFSIKANPFLLRGLPDCFDHIEVCSPGELTICEKTGADMEKVIFSGVNKTQADVDRAMADGVGVFTAESRLHLAQVNQAALRFGKTVPLLLRLTGGSQFGMDEADAMDIIAHREDYPGVRIAGIHYFTGTQKSKPGAIFKELTYVEGFLEKVRAELSFTLERVEYGTGLAVDYFAPDAGEKELARLRAIAPAIRALAEKTRLTIEMGRFFAAPCGDYFTRVMDLKHNQGVGYAILDGGLHQLKYDGQLYGMQLPAIIHIKSGEPSPAEPEKWTLCGSLCTTADVLAKNVPLAGLETGDVLIFRRTGAYSVMEGMAVFLSRDMPAVYSYSQDGGLTLLRPRLATDPFNTPI